MPDALSDKDQKTINKAVKLILGTDAMSRFTKTPINIESGGLDLEALAKKLRGLGINIQTGTLGPFKEQPSTGEYTIGTPGQINVSSWNSIPNYSDIVGTIHHEDVHALLNAAKYAYPTLEPQLPDLIYGSPVNKAIDAFAKGHRAGNTDVELPAYMSAFKPGELPGITEQDRQTYLNRLMPTLQPTTANLLQRIIQSYQASQNPPF